VRFEDVEWIHLAEAHWQAIANTVTGFRNEWEFLNCWSWLPKEVRCSMGSRRWKLSFRCSVHCSFATRH